MDEKSRLIAGAALLVLSVSSISLAGPMGGGMKGEGNGRGGIGPGMQGQTPSHLSEQQIADWKAWQEKNLQLRKEFIANLVKNGTLTQEQADAKIKAMETSYNFRMKNGFVAPGAMQGVKLTDEQKVEMKKLFEQRLELRKQALAEYVKSGQITQAQADHQLKRMQDNFNFKLENGFSGHNGGRGMGKGKRRGSMNGVPCF